MANTKVVMNFRTIYQSSFFKNVKFKIQNSKKPCLYNLCLIWGNVAAFHCAKSPSRMCFLASFTK